MKKDNLKCLVMISRYPPQPGGSQNYVHELISPLHGLGFDITVHTGWWPGSEKVDSKRHFPVIRSRIWGFLNRMSATRIRPLVILSILFHFIYSSFRTIIGNYDVIICGSLLSAGSGALVRRLFRKTPYILIIYGEEIKWLLKSWKYRRLINTVLEKSSQIIVISNFTRELLLSLSGCEEEKIHLIPPALKKEFLKKIPEIEAREEIGMHDKPVLLSVGRPEPRKGTLKLIEAFASVVKHYPDAGLYIVGKGPDLEKCGNLAQKLGIEKNVIFTGYVPDEKLKYYFAACDLFVLPNQNLPHDVEGFGIVFLEAASQEKPVIGGRSGGVTDAVIDGETGLLLEKVTPDNIASAILSLLNDPDKMKRMGKKGRQRVLKEYYPEKRKAKLRDILMKAGNVFKDGNSGS